ncbi:MAG: MBL fold metallo-hydrolase [Sphingobacteriaceae bacterium]
MKKIMFLLMLGVVFSSSAQRIKADKIKAGKDSLVIQPIFHASVVFMWNGRVVYVDPHGGKSAFEGLPSPDIILITDVHPDHTDVETLKSIQTKSNTVFVMPYEVEKIIPKEIIKGETLLQNGKEYTVRGIPIRTIPMYNLPEEADSKHPKGRGNGYVLTFGPKQVYISGDTEDIPEMRKLKDIDIAFVCMNLPYTMDIDQASSAVLEFAPKIVYPYHYRGKDGMSDTEAFKKLVNKGNPKIDVRLRNWYSKN